MSIVDADRRKRFLMPRHEYYCKGCDYTFARLLYLGDDESKVECPKCQNKQLHKLPSAPGLFEGIANFSSLAKDSS